MNIKAYVTEILNIDIIFFRNDKKKFIGIRPHLDDNVDYAWKRRMSLVTCVSLTLSFVKLQSAEIPCDLFETIRKLSFQPQCIPV